MAHEDVNFLGNDFIENLDQILYKDPGVTLSSAAVQATSAYANLDAAVGSMNSYFNTFDTNSLNAKRLPLTWDDFIIDLNSFFNTSIPANSGAILDGFVETYRAFLGIGGTTTDPVSGDWANLGAEGVTSVDIVDQFKEFFGHFLANFQYGNDGKIGVAGNRAVPFYQQFYDALTRTANLQSSTDSVLNDGSIASYEQIYLGYGFAQADFQDKLKEFYDAVVSKKGYFVPSLEFDSWFAQMRNDYLAIRNGTVSSLNIESSGQIAPTVSKIGSDKLLVIDRILRLLITMIDILNQIAAAQSERLAGFLVNYQKAYTDLMNEVPTFSGGDGTKLGGQDQAASAFESARNEVNQKMASLLEEIRSRRSLVQDDAKAMQSVINQTQDAANQQTNIATALLQQLSTILGSIFR